MYHSFKLDILNLDPLKPNLITENGRNTYLIKSHGFEYFYAFIY